MKLSVVGRGEADQKGDIDGIQTFRYASTLQFIGNSEECQYVKPIIFCLITHVGDALFCECVILAIPKDVITLDAKLVVRCDNTGSEQKRRGLDAAITVIY